MVLGVIIGECAAMLGLMESKVHVDEYHHIQVSCIELLGFQFSYGALQGIHHTGMQLVISKSLNTRGLLKKGGHTSTPRLVCTN